MYDKASLALIPSGTKASKLYSVLPANGNGDFDHTRGSTATRVNKDGLIETVAADTPRLDYPLTNGVVQDCPALLLEPSRANHLTYSEFTNADPVGWTLGFGTGTYEYDLVSYRGRGALKQTQTTTGRSYQYQNVTLLASTTYTLSMYVDVSNSNITNSGEDIMHVLADDETGDNTAEWQDIDTNTGRVSITFTTGSDTSVQIRIGLGVTGDTLSSNQVLTYSMPQLEAGSYATSYIPTLQNQAETRSADVCNGSGTSAEFNTSEGVLFIECSLFTNSGENNYFSIGDTTGTRDGVELHFRSESSRIRGIIYSNDSVTVNISTYSFNKTNNNKIAFKYKDNDFAIWVNGTEAATASSGAAPLKLSNLQFADANNSNRWYGKCKQVLVFNEALSDSELQTLTS